MNQTLERDEVLNPCIKLCKKFEMSGLILEWRRLDVFDKTHVDGSPDLELKIPHEDVVFLFMAECKKKDGGRVAALEILMGSYALSANIREGKLQQIPNFIQR